MITSFLDVLFGCSHRFSFPITVRRGQRRAGAAALTGTYVVCLECGREFPYDWERMTVVGGGSQKGRALPAAEPTGKAA